MRNKMKKALLALALGAVALPVVAQDQMRTYEQDGCTLKGCLKITMRMIPAEHGYIVTGELFDRYQGTHQRYPISGLVDDDGLVTNLRWVREPGVRDGHADVMMAKDQSTFVALIYDRDEITHQFVFHLTKESK